MYNNDDEYKVIINDKFSWWYTSLEDACDKIIQILLKMNNIDACLKGKFKYTYTPGKERIKSLKIYEITTAHYGPYVLFKKSKGSLDKELTLYTFKNIMEKKYGIKSY